MQCPVLQVNPDLQRNSPTPHASIQLPLSHTLPAGQSDSPSSTMPLQSLSTLSHNSGPGLIMGRHMPVVPSDAQSVRPIEQAPCNSVVQGMPPPVHDKPLMK